MPRRDNSDFRPPRPTGSGHAAAWAQWVHDQITERGTLIDTPQIRFQQTTKGIVPILSERRGGGGGRLQGPFLLHSVQGDYVTAKLWDGTTAGLATVAAGPDVYLAKPYRIRHSILQETLEGVVYYYTYPGDGVIGANAGGVGAFGTDGICLSRLRHAYSNAARTTLIETTVVTPEWIAGDLLWAQTAVTGVLAEKSPPNHQLTLLMPHERNWALHA